MVRYPADEKVTIENDGDIELDTGTGANAKVLTTADIFVQGSTQGLLAQLTSLANRVNQLEDQLINVTSKLDTAETQLAVLMASYPLEATLVAGVSVTQECSRSLDNTQTYGCSRESMWPVVAKAGRGDAWGCEDGSFTYSSKYGHRAHNVCECAAGWEELIIPSSYGTVIVCVKNLSRAVGDRL